MVRFTLAANQEMNNYNQLQINSLIFAYLFDLFPTVITPEQLAIDIKTNVLAVMPHFYGRKIEYPYEFLHEFCKLCGIQRRPAGSNEEDYKLRATLPPH